jgi:hypothetical protein
VLGGIARFALGCEVFLAPGCHAHGLRGFGLQKYWNVIESARSFKGKGVKIGI